MVLQTIFDPQYLVVDISNGLDYFNDKPILNRLLAPLMIPDYTKTAVLRYPGALVANSNMPSGYTVQIPVVTYSGGVEQIGTMLPVVEEILAGITSNAIGPIRPDLRYNLRQLPLLPCGRVNVSLFRRNSGEPSLYGSTIRSRPRA